MHDSREAAAAARANQAVPAALAQMPLCPRSLFLPLAVRKTLGTIAFGSTCTTYVRAQCARSFYCTYKRFSSCAGEERTHTHTRSDWCRCWRGRFSGAGGEKKKEVECFETPPFSAFICSSFFPCVYARSCIWVPFLPFLGCCDCDCDTPRRWLSSSRAAVTDLGARIFFRLGRKAKRVNGGRVVTFYRREIVNANSHPKSDSHGPTSCVWVSCFNCESTRIFKSGRFFTRSAL